MLIPIQTLMELEIREAALCLIRRGLSFLVAEIRDPQTGSLLHRPPGGGIEKGESPEQAVRRELREELGIALTTIEAIGAIDHVWFWNGREVRERAWLFLANAAGDPRLSRGECPELIEANGQRFRTVWRLVEANSAMLPPLCPSAIPSRFPPPR